MNQIIFLHDVVNACRPNKSNVFVYHLPGKIAVAVQEVFVCNNIFHNSLSLLRCISVESWRVVIMFCLNTFSCLPFMPCTFWNTCKWSNYSNSDFRLSGQFPDLSFYQSTFFKADFFFATSLSAFPSWITAITTFNFSSAVKVLLVLPIRCPSFVLYTLLALLF